MGEVSNVQSNTKRFMSSILFYLFLFFGIVQVFQRKKWELFYLFYLFSKQKINFKNQIYKKKLMLSRTRVLDKEFNSRRKMLAMFQKHFNTSYDLGVNPFKLCFIRMDSNPESH